LLVEYAFFVAYIHQVFACGAYLVRAATMAIMSPRVCKCPHGGMCATVSPLFVMTPAPLSAANVSAALPAICAPSVRCPTKILPSHTKILSRHTKVLSRHTKVLSRHTKVLPCHTPQYVFCRYWQYSLFTLFMMLVFEGTVVMSRRKNLQTLRGMNNAPRKLLVRRGNRYPRIIFSLSFPVL